MIEIEVWFCDDDPIVLDAYSESFSLEGLKVRSFPSAQNLLGKLGPGCACVILSDMRMPRMDGFGLLEAVRDIDADIPVVFLTGHGDIPMAVQALRKGAWDFVEKPADPLVLVETLRRAMESRRIILEHRQMRRQMRDLSTIEGRIIGDAPATERLRATIMQIASRSVDVLLIGETGTGKEIAARALHDFGAGRTAPFVAVNCGALAETVIESELFGHEAGAFTSADKQRIGKIEHANGGTLFLDEIESMPLATQARLLRVLQERSVVRLGSNKEIPLKLRVISAAKSDLIALAKEGTFREDLAYRLDIARLQIPPLRARGDDAVILFDHFLALAAQREGHPAPETSPEMRASLAQHDWPGNVREVRNRAERFFLGLDQDLEQRQESNPTSLQSAAELAESVAIERALRANGFRVGKTADALGISRKTLYLKLKRLNIASVRRA